MLLYTPEVTVYTSDSLRYTGRYPVCVSIVHRTGPGFGTSHPTNGGRKDLEDLFLPLEKKV